MHICERCFNCRIKFRVNKKRVYKNKIYDKLETNIAPTNRDSGFLYAYCRAGLWEDIHGNERTLKSYPSFKKGLFEDVQKCLAFEGEEGEKQ